MFARTVQELRAHYLRTMRSGVYCAHMIKYRIAATAALSAVVLGSGWAMAASDNSTAPDCQQQVVRAADRLARATEAADTTLTQWSMATRAGNQAQAGRLAELWADQRTDTYGAQADYYDARGACRA